MTDKTYNGWTNYETWVFNLWADNDGTADEWRERGVSILEDDASGDRSEAVHILAKQIEEEAEGAREAVCTTPGVFGDLLGAALWSVDWREIASHVVGGVPLFSAGNNMPGCMPDSDPAIFAGEGAQERARDCLADELEQHADELEESAGHAADEKERAAMLEHAEECRNAATAAREQVGAFTVLAGGRAWFCSAL